MIPIFEYPANNARLGAFEIVLPMLDAINNVASNRMDGIEQFIQSFIKFVNCDIDEEQFKALKEMGAIKVKSVDGTTADVSIVTQELNQMQTQTLVDYLYQTVLTICGMPNRNGGSSTSDTGAAVIMRDGWSLAESRAKDSELMFKQAEHEVLKLILRIIRDTTGLSQEIYGLRLRDIDSRFTRRNYDNIQSKAQVLVSMLQQNKIHPRLAFTACGLFCDAENAYQTSMEYYNSIASESGNNDASNDGETNE
jgi:SPP1 family phage portal protein